MSDPLRVNATTPSTRRIPSRSRPEKLRDELQQLTQQWQNLSHGWSGVAAAADTPAWDEWHDGASKIVDVLADEADKLARQPPHMHAHRSTQLRHIPPPDLFR